MSVKKQFVSGNGAVALGVRLAKMVEEGKSEIRVSSLMPAAANSLLL